MVIMFDNLTEAVLIESCELYSLSVKKALSGDWSADWNRKFDSSDHMKPGESGVVFCIKVSRCGQKFANNDHSSKQ